jgi:hypothetical protein
VNQAVIDVFVLVVGAFITAMLGLFGWLARNWAQTLHNDIEKATNKIDGLARSDNKLDRRLTRVESWQEMHTTVTHAEEDDGHA